MTGIEQVDILDLIRRDVTLKREASFEGGEYVGPCPFCGGRDRFNVWPDHSSGRGRFWCRQCGNSGDAIEYIKRRDNIGFVEACRKLGLEVNETMKKPIKNPGTHNQIDAQSRLLEPVDLPSLTWQCRAWDFIAYAGKTLWSSEGRLALEWLHARGLNDDTIKGACLGYNPKTVQVPADQFGMDEDKTVYLSSGIVIPNYSVTAANPDGRAETLWSICIRPIKPGVKSKYVNVKGSKMALYNCDTIIEDKPVVLVEGEFDALTIVQQVPEVTAVATGSTMSCRRLRWLTLLTRASLVLVSYDADDAGEKASQWWLDILKEKAKRWRPLWDDANAMHQAGVDLRSWLAPAINIDTP